MVTEAPSRAVVLVTTLFTLSCIGLILFVWKSLGGSSPLESKGYRITAVFTDASQLATHADVRIAGVDVGKVTKVEQVGLTTHAEMQLDQQYAPLPRDVRAILRQKTLLGETFIALTPGTPGAPVLPDGGEIPPSQIGDRQPLDRLLGALDARTRANLQKLLTGTADAFDGRGTDLNAALGDLDPAAEQLAAIVTVLDRQSRNVRSLVRGSGTILDTIATRDADVQGLVRNGESVLAATASRNRALTATVRALPGFVAQLRSTMRRVDTTAQLATPTLRALEPAARFVRPTLAGLDRLAPKATRAFREFAGLIPVARRALPAASRIVGDLTPFTTALYPAAQNIVPVINLVAAYKQELNGSIANVAAALNASSPDSTGVVRPYLRAVIPFTEEGLTGQAERSGSNRHNAYPAPGTWSTIGREGLPASDCRDADKPAGPVLGTGAPPCRVQGPWTFMGEKRYFPHLVAATPPGR